MKQTILNRIALPALVSLLLAGCAGTNSKQFGGLIDAIVPEGSTKQVLKGANDATREWTPEEERQFGQEMSAVLLGARPLVKNMQVQRYVNQVGLWIAMQSAEPNLPWRFGVIDSNNVNAFAAPGGYVFITKGLFLRLNNESELAGVLGHEITHVVKHHHVKIVKKRGMVQIGAGLVQSQVDKSGGGAADKAVQQAMLNASKNLLSSGLDKEDEYDADREGVVLAARAGYSPYGLPTVLQMYAASAGDSGLDLLFATHPAPTDRLNRLDKLMGDKLDALPKPVVDVSRFKAMQKLLK